MLGCGSAAQGSPTGQEEPGSGSSPEQLLPPTGIHHHHLWSGHCFRHGFAARPCLKDFLVAVGCEKELWEWELQLWCMVCSRLCCEHPPRWPVTGARFGLCSSSPLSCFWTSLFPTLCFPQTPWNPAMDTWWHELLCGASTECEPEWCDAEDELFILYTSGSTGKPKVCSQLPARHRLSLGTPQLGELVRGELGGPSTRRRHGGLREGLCWSFLLSCCWSQ